MATSVCLGQSLGHENFQKWGIPHIFGCLKTINFASSETCLVPSSKGTQGQYLLSEVLQHYQGWFMYMRYTQGQNEGYLLSRSMY